QRVRQLDFLVALGTHPPLDDLQLSKLVGQKVVDGQAGQSRIYNHEWDKPDTFTLIGTIPAPEIDLISGGLLRQDVPVHVNKLIFAYDQVIIAGPVFPHEVAGFSGGNKYFFPGIAGSEIINLTHWLGALITNYKIIGTMHTPVRAVINRAASMVKLPTFCFAFVVDHAGVAGIFCGTTDDAWNDAAKLSEIRHIIYKDKPFKRVLSIMPEMYTDLWTAAKGMYKLEPVVQDGGEVIIYAPHIHEVSYTHGKLLDEIGYHCRDYFLAQMERFKHYPGGLLAHSTHVTGLGCYDPQTGQENTRIKVSLATGIPEERCRKIKLGYVNPSSIDIVDWKDHEQDGILVVENAGEILYRLIDQ
ncbi:MAG TPA: lactate racemase domain-containing protein, partial [Anaerolineales bacterium]|nr:lactate racemase domain-containing protein [Anaerolineales bacterium]